MNPFKGTIEKKVMAQVRTFIKNAEQELKDFVTTREEDHNKKVEEMEEQLEADKTAKETEIVNKIVGKFM